MDDPTDVFAVFDETGHHVQWPWEKVHPSSAKKRRHLHRLDSFIQTAMLASSADGKMGANTTGVRKWHKFCQSEGVNPHRPLDPNSPLLSKLREEWLCMRFVVSLLEYVHRRIILRPSTGMARKGVWYQTRGRHEVVPPSCYAQRLAPHSR
jgi:hypothetical protein